VQATPVKCMSCIVATPGIYYHWNIRLYIVAISFYSILFLVSGSEKNDLCSGVCVYVGGGDKDRGIILQYCEIRNHIYHCNK
jgi:hypothetical protein